MLEIQLVRYSMIVSRKHFIVHLVGFLQLAACHAGVDQDLPIRVHLAGFPTAWFPENNGDYKI
jgi:hypothetical protein